MLNSNKQYINRSQLEPMVSDGPRNPYTNVKTSRIFLATIAANLSAMAIGTCLSWSSPIGPKLISQDTSDSPLNRPISANEHAWISSVCTIGALLTPFISGPWANKIGRKRVLLSSSIFFISGYILLLIANEVWVLIVGRLTLGFGCGFAMSIIPVYVGEISTHRNRGATVTMMSFSIGVGGCYVKSIGPFVSYTMLQYFCLFVPMVFVIAFSFMPESPYYSVARGQRAAASKALQFLRGQDAQTVELELKSVESLVSNLSIEKVGIFEIFKESDSRKALFIALGLIFFKQTSGVMAVIFYTQSIFESAHINLEAPIAAIFVSIVQVTNAGLAPMVANKFLRKMLLFNSATFMGISLAALGYFFYSQIELEVTNGLTWLPLTALVLYITSFELGFGTVPWAVLNEMFPPNTKSIAAAMATSLAWLVAFFVGLSFPLFDALGIHFGFWMFSGFCGLAVCFVLFVVVETKDLSFAEIRNKLNSSL